MKKITENFNKFYQENPKSVTLSKIIQYDEITKFYTNLYNIDRLECALLEEGAIDPDVTVQFIKDLKSLMLVYAWDRK